mmetsp:Transcript_15441/g.31985  ORF Transcript_15441/g.31985 Transcript_15441/m.31985 type:complete len:118 (+) Transcript_15441:1671-2024(+)
MRSFLSTLFFCLLLTISCLPNGIVDARINTPGDASTINVADTVISVSHSPQGSHRSLGGGVKVDASFPKNHRSLAQTQSWARDDDGKILWWIWLTIGLSSALFCIVCCCASACCLRD